MPLAVAERLTALRGLLTKHALSAYVVGSADAHASEYVSARDKRREFLSGFTGSAGTAVVTPDTARLWTDGRYFQQAVLELDGSWGLMKDRLPETPSIEGWLAANVTKGAGAVGLDGVYTSLATARRIATALAPVGVTVSDAGGVNLVDAVWGGDQPAPPSAPIVPHSVALAGVSCADKLTDLGAAVTAAGASALVLTSLDEVAWVFNLRGGDVECCPVFHAWAVIHASGAGVLYVDSAKLTPAAAGSLAEAGVVVKPYGDVLADVAALPGKLWLDPSTANAALFAAAAGKPLAAALTGDSSSRVLEKMSPVQLKKAVKNEAELKGMRAAHIRDGGALVTFLSWLQGAVRGVDTRGGKSSPLPPGFVLNEATAADVLDGFRAALPGFVSLSFPTIAGSGSNGAIIHYRATPATAKAISADSGIFLLDSGGQYVDGTTDVTRTVHFGVPTDVEKAAFTSVLQAHISMAEATFPRGTSGIAVDALARVPMWARGLDYAHGTGHGVGAFLNVHEGPQYCASAARSTYEGGLVEGMTLTDEPGLYVEGVHGVRIENVLEVVAVPALGPKTLGFTSMTVAPISPHLIEPTQLLAHEAEWVNAYNARVRAALLPALEQDPVALAYLMEETRAVERPATGWAVRWGRGGAPRV